MFVSDAVEGRSGRPNNLGMKSESLGLTKELRTQMQAIGSIRIALFFLTC